MVRLLTLFKVQLVGGEGLDAGTTWNTHGSAWRPIELVAQQVRVPYSFWDVGRYVSWSPVALALNLCGWTSKLSPLLFICHWKVTSEGSALTSQCTLTASSSEAPIMVMSVSLHTGESGIWYTTFLNVLLKNSFFCKQKGKFGFWCVIRKIDMYFQTCCLEENSNPEENLTLCNMISQKMEKVLKWRWDSNPARIHIFFYKKMTMMEVGLLPRVYAKLDLLQKMMPI